VVGESVHQLVTPAVPSTTASMKIHQILPRDLERAASPGAAGAALCDALERRFLLTWYADVELAFLQRMFGGRPKAWSRRTVDVLRLALELEHADPDARLGLSTAAKRYGVPVANPHEALDDALVTAQLFVILASKLQERGFGSVRSYLRLTRP
jgi:DNA polymerase-3 subunit epsilon